jgi:hypothetical protein
MQHPDMRPDCLMVVSSGRSQMAITVQAVAIPGSGFSGLLLGGCL